MAKWWQKALRYSPHNLVIDPINYVKNIGNLDQTPVGVERIAQNFGLIEGEGQGGDYQMTPETRAYYNKLNQILENPEAFAVPEAEQREYMNLARREGQLSARQTGNEFDIWAAGRNISGGVEAEAKIKIMQELIRNLQRSRTSLNMISLNARNQARLAALGGLGQVTGQLEQGNLMAYQQQLLQEQERENAMANLIGTGVKVGASYLFPPAAPYIMGASSGIGSTPGTRVKDQSWYG